MSISKKEIKFNNKPIFTEGEWKLVTLGDVAMITAGGSAPQGEHYFNGNHPFIRVKHIDNKDYLIRKFELITDKAIRDYKLILYPKGTIVFPKSGASVYLEKRAILPTEAYIVSHLCAVNANDESIYQHFLFYVFLSTKLADKKASGYPTLNLSEVKKLKIPLPPLQEQKKIAGVLGAVQEAKEKTEAVLKAAKELKKSMMKHLFTYGPVSIKEAEKVKLKETEIGMMPEDWEVKKLINICLKIQDGSHYSPKIQYNSPGKNRYLYITSKNIRENGIDLSTATYVDYSFHSSIYNRCNPEREDVFLVKDGVMTGTSTVNTLDEEISLLSSVTLLKPNKEYLNQHYLNYYLNSEKGYRTITGEMSGSAIKRIILAKIKAANWSFPKNVDTLLRLRYLHSILYRRFIIQG
jgi:type I restriction enzyme, S subunit